MSLERLLFSGALAMVLVTGLHIAHPDKPAVTAIRNGNHPERRHPVVEAPSTRLRPAWENPDTRTWHARMKPPIRLDKP